MKKTLLKILPFSLLLNLKIVKQYLVSILFLGNKYQCPNCNTGFRKMFKCGQEEAVLEKYQVIGSGIRENCLCPRCYSIDRERLIYLYLSKKTNIFSENIKLLHIAPRQSLRKIFKNSHNITYYQGDKYEEGYHYPKDVIALDITELNYKDNYFDVIICNHVLEHIPNDFQAMKELYRVLKPNGFAILQVPISLKLNETFEIKSNTAEERKQLYGQFDHYRIYAKDFTNRLESCNFRVSLYYPADIEKNLDTERFGLNKSEYLIVANK